MRIAVASDDGAHVALHTGRCRGFAVFEIAGNTANLVEHRVNAFTAHARGECRTGHAQPGASGHQSHGPLIQALADCQVLVARGLGPRLVADLSAHGIDAFACTVETVGEAARLYALGQLRRAAAGACGCHH